jgi:hypothetical protein
MKTCPMCGMQLTDGNADHQCQKSIEVLINELADVEARLSRAKNESVTLELLINELQEWGQL